MCNASHSFKSIFLTNCHTVYHALREGRTITRSSKMQAQRMEEGVQMGASSTQIAHHVTQLVVHGRSMTD